MSMMSEFKEFSMKGNVVDLAVGVIIGGAFGKIVTSLVSDVIMPILGLVLGKLDFTTLVFKVGEAGPTIRYGGFLQSVVDFLVVAWSIFLAVRFLNRFRKEKPVEVPAQEKLLTEIRDLLKK